MPQGPPHECSKPGCRALVPAGQGGRCPGHRAVPFAGAVRTADRARPGNGAPQGQQFYRNERWRKARETHLGHYPDCARCGAPATSVDHIVPHDGSPEQFWNTANWQSLCADCHNSKSAQWAVQKREARKAGDTAKFAVPVTVVCGPPGSGKTSYVEERRKWGDLTVDLDAIYQAITGLPMYETPLALLPFVTAARDALVDRLSRPAPEVKRAWVIQGGARQEDRERYQTRGASVVVLAVPEDECLRRISKDVRRSGGPDAGVGKVARWQPLVERWWREYSTKDGYT